MANIKNSIQFGKIGIDFYCCRPEVEANFSSSLRGLKELLGSDIVLDKLTMIFVSAETPEGAEEYLQGLPTAVRPLVALAQRAWIKATDYDAASGGNGGGALLRDWRALLNELEIIVPQLGIYRWKRSAGKYFLRFLPHSAKTDNSRRIVIETLNSLGLYWYALQGGLACLHASAVLRTGKGFVFLGPNEAGKSTAAVLSLEAGGQIIDDDLVSLAREGEKEYTVLTPRVWGEWLQDPNLPMPGFVEVGPGVPVAGIFVLTKAEEDRLVPLSDLEAAYELIRQALGMDNNLKLPMSRDTARRIFKNCCTIASRVPAYQLYFRKSPDFWKLIDDTLGK